MKGRVKLKTMLFDARSITPKPCGVRNVTENYLHGLHNHFDVIAIVNKGSEFFVSGAIKTVALPGFFSRFNPLSDLLISFLTVRYRADLFFSGHSFLPAFALLPKKRIFICHDLFAAFDPSFFASKGRAAFLARLFFRILLEISFFRASLVISPSRAVQQSFSRLYFRARRMAAIPNGIANSVDVLQEIPRKKEILFVGNFRAYKGIDVLLKAWSALKDLGEMDGWSLRIVSNESSSSFAQLLRQYPGIERVQFASRVSDQELNGIRSSSSLFIVPSREEGFGLPLIEAISAGGAVICSEIPVFSELLEELDQSFISTFPTEDADVLTDLIVSVCQQLPAALNSSEFRRTFAWNRSILAERYSWENSVHKSVEEISAC